MTDEDKKLLQTLLVRIDELERIVAAQPKLSKAWDMAMKALVPVVIAIAGWGIGHEIRMSNLELTSMSKVDGHALEDRIGRKFPPEWLREDLKEVKQLLRDQDQRMRAIEARVK